MKSPIIKDSFEFWSYWFKHGGPHILWISGVLAGLYSFGLIDVPAWSKDVREIATRITTIEKKLKTNSKKLNQIMSENAAALERDSSQQRQLNVISSKLNILVDRAIEGRR